MAYAPYPFEKTTTVPAADEFIVAGKTWRIGRFFSAVPASGYATITFKTPADMITLYQLANVGKTGGEFQFTIVEGGTYSGGTALIPFNLNRKTFSTKVCELTDLKYGVSPAATVSGGTEAPPDYLPGENTGSNRVGSAVPSASFIELLPDTVYTLKATNIASVAGNVNILFLIAVGI